MVKLLGGDFFLLQISQNIDGIHKAFRIHKIIINKTQ